MRKTSIAGAIDAAFSQCIDALEQPAFAHLLGIGIVIGNDIRMGGSAVDRRTNIFSVTKAVLARGVHEAFRSGVFAGYDEQITLGRSDCRPTIGNLLGMTQSWLTEPDMDALEARPVDPLPEIVTALDPAPHTGQYVNAGMHLLMRELHHRTGSARQFLDLAVLAPAGVNRARWEADATGVPWGYAHLHLSVHDLLRLGSHWLGQGRLVLRPKQATPPIAPEGLPYADGLWLGDGYLLAAGWGGQCLMLVPSANAVLVALGDTGWDRITNQHTLPDGWQSGRQLFERHLLPALLA